MPNWHYSITLEHMEIEEDPFDNFPGDENVQMPDEVPFNDSVDLPEV